MGPVSGVPELQGRGPASGAPKLQGRGPASSAGTALASSVLVVLALAVLLLALQQWLYSRSNGS